MAKQHHLANVYPQYMDSIHGYAVSQEGLLVAANCESCHGSHHVLSHTNPQSPTYKTAIPEPPAENATQASAHNTWPASTAARSPTAT